MKKALSLLLSAALALSLLAGCGPSRLRVRTASVRDIALPAPWLQERNESGFPRPSVM